MCIRDSFATSKSAYVFKTIADPFIGKYSLIKVCSGVIKSDDTLYNATTETEEKISKLYVMRANRELISCKITLHELFTRCV